jgi:hypothetical protein
MNSLLSLCLLLANSVIKKTIKTSVKMTDAHRTAYKKCLTQFKEHLLNRNEILQVNTSQSHLEIFLLDALANKNRLALLKSRYLSFLSIK